MEIGCVTRNKVRGEGKLTWNKITYIGSYFNDKFNGFNGWGVYTWPDGQKYEI